MYKRGNKEFVLDMFLACKDIEVHQKNHIRGVYK